MGRFLNPDNSAFQTALNSQIYVDKSGLMAYTNRVLDTRQSLICNSRPRRFGKSMTADMLTAYYSRGCDSLQMFEKLRKNPILRLMWRWKITTAYRICSHGLQRFKKSVKSRRSAKKVIGFIETILFLRVRVMK